MIGFQVSTSHRSPSPKPRDYLEGGVGISPFIDLLSGLRLEDAGWQRVHLVWAVRGDEFGGISGAIDWRRLCERAEISVFVTSAEAESPSGMVDHRMGSSDFQASASASEMCRHRVLILSFVFITLGALAADFLVHNWSIWVRHTVHSLLAWASLARCVPLLLVLVVLLAVTLLNFALQRAFNGRPITLGPLGSGGLRQVHAAGRRRGSRGEALHPTREAGLAAAVRAASRAWASGGGEASAVRVQGLLRGLCRDPCARTKKVLTHRRPKPT